MAIVLRGAHSAEKESVPNPVRILADTHVLIWYADDSLSHPVRQLIASAGTKMYFSIESIREIAIKSSLGKSEFDYSARAVRSGLLMNGWQELPLRAEHIFALESLAFHHRDPFDRMLVAQAQVEDLTLMTADGILSKYGIPVLTV